MSGEGVEQVGGQGLSPFMWRPNPEFMAAVGDDEFMDQPPLFHLLVIGDGDALARTACGAVQEHPIPDEPTLCPQCMAIGDAELESAPAANHPGEPKGDAG